MKNECGFFTITALCLLLIISLSITTIQHSEKIYSYDVTSFQAETELQNAADSGLIEAAEKVRLNAELIKDYPTIFYNRSQRQYSVPVSQLNSERLGNIKIEVYGERGTIEKYLRDYSTEDETTSAGYIDKNLNSDSPGIILISVASCENKITGKKMYARSLAYISDDEQNILHFMNHAERGKLNTD